MYCSRLEGTPICTTSVTSSKSTPRAVTSLVIITADRDLRNKSVAFERRLWLSLEWISITSSRISPNSEAASAVPLAVVKNTMILCLPGCAAQCSSTRRLSCANCSSSGAISSACDTCALVVPLASSPTQSTKACPSRSDARAMCLISALTVAENRRVWRCFVGTCFKIFSTEGLNPMSSSRSASSSTSV